MAIVKIYTYFLIFILFISSALSCSKQPNKIKSSLDDYSSSYTSITTNRDSIKNDILNLNNQGVTLRNKCQYKEALQVHFKALEKAVKYNDTLGQIYSNNNIANDLRRTDSNIEATKYYLDVLESCGSDPQYDKSRAIAYNGLGNINIVLNKLEDAENYLSQALKIEQHLKSPLGIAINYANLGEVKRLEGNFEEAIDFFQKSISENNKINNKTGEAICFDAIGRVYADQKEYAKAIFYSEQAINKLNNKDDVYHLLRFYLGLLRAYVDAGLIDKAEIISPSVLGYAQKLNSFTDLKETYHYIAEIEKLKGNLNKYITANELKHVYSDSIRLKSNEMVVYELQYRFNFNQIEQKIKFLEQENSLAIKSKNNIILIFILVAVVLMFVSLFFYYRDKNKKIINQELKKLNELKTKFFTNISHEFKTPLTLIKGPVNQLLKSDLKKEDLESLKLIEKSANSLYDLVLKILNVNKVESNKFEIYYQDGNLSVLIQDIADRFKVQVENKELKYKVELEPSNIIKIDKTVVEIILNNLISNAVKFTPTRGEIFILGKKKANTYRLRIKNTLDDENLKINKIFDRFYSKSKYYSEGTGIGLSLVQEMCKLYHANIEVNTIDNQYIEFIVDFKIIPVSYVDIKDKYIQDGNMKITSLAEEELDKPTILIVEDNIDMLNYLSSIFIDYHVLKATNGEEGFIIANQSLPTLIISDVMMPVIDGLKLCQKIKSNPLTNHIPVILLSANTEEETVFEGLANLADDYMFKPFASEILLAKVENLIKLRKLLTDKYASDIQTKSLNKLLTKTDPFQKKLSKIIEEEIYDPDFGVEQFCRSTGISRSLLHKKLKALFNMNTTEFIQYHRLKIASELLKKSNFNITEICYESGFNSLSYFSKQFKQFFGISPIEYRKKYTKNL